MEDADWQFRLKEAAERIRTSRALGKSAQINRLFDYLVERSLMGAATKEIEVAREVFGLSVDSHVGLDATVRANVHRLRKKLEEIAAQSAGDSLSLPRGEYRLVLVPGEPAQNDQGDNPVKPSASAIKGSARLPWAIVAALSLTLLVCLGWILSTDYQPADSRASSAFWSPLKDDRFPTLTVLGDYYMFGELDKSGAVSRLIREPAIDTRQELDQKKMQVGGSSLAFVDLDYHYLPEAMGPALVMVGPIVRAASGESGRGSVVASRFTTEMLGRNNIVYVGLLSGLGVLEDPLFEGSNFAFSNDGEKIIDLEENRSFQSDWADPSEDRILRKDYAYIASRPGPVGNWILVIAGTHDPGLKEAAQIVSNRSRLEQLARFAGNGAFEAVYEVRTYGPSNYNSRLLMARRIPKENKSSQP